MFDDHWAVDFDGKTVTVRGELDFTNHAALIAAIALQPPGTVLSLDLSGVTFIDSMGLSALIELNRSLPGVHVVEASDNVRRLFEITGLTSLLMPPAAGL